MTTHMTAHTVSFSSRVVAYGCFLFVGKPVINDQDSLESTGLNCFDNTRLN